MKFRKILNLLRNSKNLFKNMWNENSYGHISIDDTNLWRFEGESSNSKKEDKRIVKKPVEIFEEIISEKPIINLNNLDEQIKLVKERMQVLQQHTRGINLNDEKMAINYLQARKKFEKYKHLFKWEITNREMIDKLCKKYKVMMVSFQNYYKNIPKEGVDEIKKFGEAFENVSNNDPVFKLIVDDGGKETKKDPILLAASPFGNWFYILGAWDKEVEIVDKLIYSGK
ncbi:MAG: hypothetical protein ACFFG0_03300 [Candidatus Thorarchaeota archaeon]